MTNTNDDNQSPDSDDQLIGPAERQASDDNNGCHAGAFERRITNSAPWRD